MRNQVSASLDDEVVILNLDSGVYYGLDEVAARIWDAIQEPHSVCEVQRLILDEYDVDPNVCMNDVTRVIRELDEHGLIATVAE
jgi:hypothetical protein